MFNKIPLELRKYNQWICWEDIVKKKPINPKYHKNYLASSTNPDTWGTFEQTILAYNKLNVDGIGFVFTEDDPFVGIDIDDCRNPIEQTLTADAMKIISLLDSYTEISPSGTGLHVIVKSKLPFKRKKCELKDKKGKLFEIYEQGQYFTMTGGHYFPTPSTIEDRDDQVFQLLDKHFPDLIIQTSDKEIIKLVKKNCKNIGLMISPWKK